MCWSKQFKTKEEALYASKHPLIADADYIVYKLLYKLSETDFSSLNIGFNYKKGYLYTESKFETQITELITWNKQTNKFDSIAYEFSVFEGLHSYAKLNGQMWGGPYFYLLPFILPKGSKYWISEDKGLKNQKIIVSNKLWLPDVDVKTLPNLKTF